jgi:hypothetical protein
MPLLLIANMLSRFAISSSGVKCGIVPWPAADSGTTT